MYNNNNNENIPNIYLDQPFIPMINNQQHQDSTNEQYPQNGQMADLMMQKNENMPYYPPEIQYNQNNYQICDQHPYFPQYNGSQHAFQYVMNQPIPHNFAQFKQQYTNSYFVKVNLKNSDHWHKLNAEVNEMMVLNNGREIFPKLEYSVVGLHAFLKYRTGIKLRRTLPHALKYSRTEPFGWVQSKEIISEVPLETKEILLDKQNGYMLMQNGIVFNSAKIYNVGKETKKKPYMNKNSEERKEEVQEEVQKDQKEARNVKGNITSKVDKKKFMMEVKSHCMYIPILTIYDAHDDNTIHKINSFEFWETAFVVTTCYKNEKVRHLKIKMNPFVRGDVKRKCVLQKTSSSQSTSTSASLSSPGASSSAQFNSTSSSPSDFSTPTFYNSNF